MKRLFRLALLLAALCGALSLERNAEAKLTHGPIMGTGIK